MGIVVQSYADGSFGLRRKQYVLGGPIPSIYSPFPYPALLACVSSPFCPFFPICRQTCPWFVAAVVVLFAIYGPRKHATTLNMDEQGPRPPGDVVAHADPQSYHLASELPPANILSPFQIHPVETLSDLEVDSGRSDTDSAIGSEVSS